MGYEEPVEEKKQEVKKPVKKEKPKEEVMVVKELPMQPVRQVEDPTTGIITNFVTIEEALTKLIGGNL